MGRLARSKAGIVQLCSGLSPRCRREPFVVAQYGKFLVLLGLAIIAGTTLGSRCLIRRAWSAVPCRRQIMISPHAYTRYLLSIPPPSAGRAPGQARSLAGLLYRVGTSHNEAAGYLLRAQRDTTGGGGRVTDSRAHLEEQKGGGTR